MSWRTAADVLTTAAILITCATLLWNRWVPEEDGPPVPTAPLSIEGASVRGDSSAPVVIIEWSDYQCPFCGRAEREILPTLDTQFVQTGRVQLAFRHLPLEQIHPRAMAAAQAALCAGAEGRFWEMHAALFTNPERLDSESVLDRARKIHVDESNFKACVSGPLDPRIANDVAAAKTLSLTGTPVFLIGLRRADRRVDVVKVISGARPIAEFVAAIDLLLSHGRNPWASLAVVAGTGAVGLVIGSAVLWRRRGRGSLNGSAFRAQPDNTTIGGH